MLLDLLTLSCYPEKVMYSIFSEKIIEKPSLGYFAFFFWEEGDVNLKILL